MGKNIVLTVLNEGAQKKNKVNISSSLLKFFGWCQRNIWFKFIPFTNVIFQGDGSEKRSGEEEAVA